MARRPNTVNDQTVKIRQVQKNKSNFTLIYLMKIYITILKHNHRKHVLMAVLKNNADILYAR